MSAFRHVAIRPPEWDLCSVGMVARTTPSDLTRQGILGILVGDQHSILDLIQPQHGRGVLSLLENKMEMVNARTELEEADKPQNACSTCY